MKKEIIERLSSCGIIPVIKINDASDAVDLASALLAGGIDVAEITYRSDAAGEAIRRIHKEKPQMLIAAGTVLSVECAKDALANGASLIVSPGLNPTVASWCVQNGVPVMPGVATPSEVEEAMALGLSHLKLFPAQVVGGTAMLNALSGPYASCSFMPTGGINKDNLADFARTKNVICAGGTWMVKENLIKEKKWDEISALCAEAKEIWKKARA